MSRRASEDIPECLLAAQRQASGRRLNVSHSRLYLARGEHVLENGPRLLKEGTRKWSRCGKRDPATSRELPRTGPSFLVWQREKCSSPSLSITDQFCAGLLLNVKKRARVPADRRRAFLLRVPALGPLQGPHGKLSTPTLGVSPPCDLCHDADTEDRSRRGGAACPWKQLGRQAQGAPLLF